MIDSMKVFLLWYLVLADGSECPLWTESSPCPHEILHLTMHEVQGPQAGKTACLELCRGATVEVFAETDALFCQFDPVLQQCSISQCSHETQFLRHDTGVRPVARCILFSREIRRSHPSGMAPSVTFEAVPPNKPPGDTHASPTHTTRMVIHAHETAFTLLALTCSVLSLFVSVVTFYLVYNVMENRGVERSNIKVTSTAPEEGTEMVAVPVGLRTTSTPLQPRFYSIVEDFSTISALIKPDKRMSTASPAGLPRRVSASEGEGRPPLDLNGCWKCVNTWGLDEFLQKMQVNRFQRMAANKAPWPTWEFHQANDKIKYVNHSAMGDCVEEFVVGGPEYTVTDLKGYLNTCKAYWEDDALKIDKVIHGQGSSTEVRTITNDKLEFYIYVPAVDFKWGRTFERVPHE